MIIISQKLLTLQDDELPVNHDAVVFSRGVIIAAGTAEKMLKKHPGHRVCHIENAVLMPGLINVHTHHWVLNLIQVKKELDLKEYAIAAKQNVRSLMLSVTTTVGEICSL